MYHNVGRNTNQLVICKNKAFGSVSDTDSDTVADCSEIQ